MKKSTAFFSRPLGEMVIESLKQANTYTKGNISSTTKRIVVIAPPPVDVVGFRGEIVQDLAKPDGTPRKLTDTTRLRNLGWKPRIGLREGIEATYRWYVEGGTQLVR